MRKSIIGHEHHPIRRLLASRMGFPVGQASENAGDTVTPARQLAAAAGRTDRYVMFAFGHGGGSGVTLTSVGSRWLSLLRRQALDLLIASRAEKAQSHNRHFSHLIRQRHQKGGQALPAPSGKN
jgi:hypothetical protein